MCGKKYLLGLLLFLVPLSLFSLSPTDPSEMTRAEITAELQTISEERAEELTQRERRATEKEADLAEKEKDLIEREADLETKRQRYEEKEIALTALMNYWQSFAAVIKQEKSDSYWAGFLAGSSLGLFVGSTGSIAVFISIQSG